MIPILLLTYQVFKLSSNINSYIWVFYSICILYIYGSNIYYWLKHIRSIYWVNQNQHQQWYQPESNSGQAATMIILNTNQDKNMQIPGQEHANANVFSRSIPLLKYHKKFQHHSKNWGSFQMLLSLYTRAHILVYSHRQFPNSKAFLFTTTL